MKKHLLNSVAILVINSTVAIAQPVLTATGINPVIGEIYTLKYGNYASPGNAGANQTWNLSAINATSTTNYTVATVASAPNSGSFTASSNMQMNDGNIYAFLNISSGAYQNSGIIGGGTNIIYSDNEDIMHFPFSMNNTFSDTWAASFSVSSYNYTRTGTTTVTYDGYGSLILPTGTFNNVARLHLVQDYQDAYSFGTNTYKNDEYIWLINNHHQPIAGVTTLTVTTGAGTTANQSGFYSNNASLATSIKTESSDAASLLSVFPNPAFERVNFVLRNGVPVQGISLSDQYGKLVYFESINATISNAAVKLDGFAGGVYIARITGANGVVYTQKISVVKPD